MGLTNVWAPPTVIYFFIPQNFENWSCSHFEAEEGEQQPILMGLFPLTKTSSFRQAHKNILLLLSLPNSNWRWKQTPFLEHFGTKNLRTVEWTISETLVKCNHILLLQFTFTVTEIKLKHLCIFHPFQNLMSTHFITPPKWYSCQRKA